MIITLICFGVFLVWSTIMSMIFAGFVKTLIYGSDPYEGVDLNDDSTLPEEYKKKFIELTRFGITQGLNLQLLATFKMLEDCGGIYTGTFENIKQETNKNIDWLMGDVKRMEEWNGKYSEYIKQSKAEDSGTENK